MARQYIQQLSETFSVAFFLFFFFLLHTVTEEGAGDANRMKVWGWVVMGMGSQCRKDIVQREYHFIGALTFETLSSHAIIIPKF